MPRLFMEKQEDRIRKAQEEKLLEEIFGFHIQRKNLDIAQKLLKSVRIVTWYNFVIKSGVELSTIRLKPRGITSKDTYRRWNHWKKGNGKVEEDDLVATELKAPGSRVVFEKGPDGAPLWKALDNTNNAYDEASNYHEEFIKYSEEEYISVIIGKALIDSRTDRSIKLRKYLFKEESYWHKLTRAVLLYRQHSKIEIIPFSTEDKVEIFSIKRNLSNRSKADLINILAHIKSEAVKHGTPHKTILEIINRLYLAPFKA